MKKRMGEFDDICKRYITMTENTVKKEYSNKKIIISHLLHSIFISTTENIVHQVLIDLGIDINLVIDIIESCIDFNEGQDYKESTEVTYCEKYNQIIKYALDHSLKPKASILDIFLAALKIKNEITPPIKQIGLNYDSAKEVAIEISNPQGDLTNENIEYVLTSLASKGVASDDGLGQYCTNMLQMALDGKYSNCIGRDEEMDIISRILCREKKGNIILIGKEGVGKTQIIEGLANKIILGDVYTNLLNFKLYSLDVNALVAGTKYRGEFEQRVDTMLKSLSKIKDVILFIDEIHVIMGAGSSEGGLDLSNILKPYITGNNFKIIGATTTEEYRKYIDKNKAFRRRFQDILINPPNRKSCLNILQEVKKNIQKRHNVEIGDSILESCIDLSEKYLPYRTLPDKAIDILEDTAIATKFNTKVSNNLKSLLEIQRDIHQEKLDIIKSKNYDWAADLINKSKEIEIKIQREYSFIKENQEKIQRIEISDVIKTIQRISKIPIENNINPLELKVFLNTKIVGQTEAIDTIINRLTINSLGLNNPDKPLASFMFVGNSGVGKTDTANNIAEHIFGDKSKILRVDCSEYGQSHDVSKLIGSSSGYVGYEEGGLLTKHIKYNPFSLILFDEIEKGSEKLFDLILQILGEGRLTDSYGDTIDFKNTIIIFTSNLGTNIATKASYIKGEAEYDENIINRAITNKFKPEFINRFDNIIHFKPLSKDSLSILLDKEIIKMNRLLEKRGVVIELAQETKNNILDKCVNPSYGARELFRIIDAEIKQNIAAKIIVGNFTKILL